MKKEFIEKELRNLARVRRAYREITDEQVEALLENTMAVVQDLLWIMDIDWEEYDPDEPLE
jgi:hypothetical protein